MKYLKAILLWFCLLIIIYILAENYLTRVSIIPEPEYQQTFLKMKSDLVFSFSFLTSLLICPFFYKNFRKGIINIKSWNIFAVIVYSLWSFIIIIKFFSDLQNLQIKPIMVAEKFVSFNKSCNSKTKNPNCKYEFATQNRSNLKFSTSIKNYNEVKTPESQFIENLQTGDCISFYIWADKSVSDFKKC